jgi:hypothetical protein
MDYRTSLPARNGIIALARGQLEATDRIDGAEVRVGVLLVTGCVPWRNRRSARERA